MPFARLFLFAAALTLFAENTAAQVASSRLSPGASLESLELVYYSGLSEKIFDALLESDRTASFYYGNAHDVTYRIPSTGMLTVKFFEGKAGLFRLITIQAQTSAEDLLWMLGVDTDQLVLTEERDVKKVWSGYQDELGLQEVTAINDAGWKVAEVKVAGYPHN